MATQKQITAAGEEVFEMFGACGEAPDDVEVGRQADAALQHLEELLRQEKKKSR